jgi:hypothetical protein
MMDLILLSGLGTAALLLIELRDFIRDRWPRRPGIRSNSLSVAESATAAQSAPAPGTWQPGHRFSTQGPRVTYRWSALHDIPVARGQCRDAAKVEGVAKDGWQTTARRLAGQWTVLDGVISHHEAHVYDAGAMTESVIRRTLSPDQILSARINAAYAVWTAARWSQPYGE